MLAAEALNICSELNVSVPGEMAILGIDDDEAVCENATVSLSSIRPNFEEAGRVAADFLEARMEAGGRFKGPFQRYFAASGVVRRASTRRLAYNDATVLKALEVIRRRACKGLKPKDVVSEMPESRRTIEYRFRKLRGRSIMDEILSVRLERAKQLLVRRDMPIEAIAEACGWKSTARLRTFFREVEGVSTSEWRAEVAPASERR